MSGNNANYNSESHAKPGKGWVNSFAIGPRRSALANLPADEKKFPVSTWLKELLSDGTQQFVLNSQLIRKSSPPNQLRGFKPDGSNLPWVIEDLRRRRPSRFKEWLAHVQTALPDIVDVVVRQRDDDRHKYIMVHYRNGIDVPSWGVSDGTLRLLALTLAAYLPELDGLFLVEEPENGIHPRAIETVFQSLSSVYGAQVLLASHSSVILGCAKADDLLCFAKDVDGGTDIVLGSDHPRLREWKTGINLGDLLVAGVLG